LKRLSVLDLPITGLSSFYTSERKSQWDFYPDIPGFFRFFSFFPKKMALFTTFPSLFFANL